MQPQGHTQLMVRMIDYGQSPQTAIDGPRFRVMTGLDVNRDSNFPPATMSELARRGHRLVELPEGAPRSAMHAVDLHVQCFDSSLFPRSACALSARLPRCGIGWLRRGGSLQEALSPQRGHRSRRVSSSTYARGCAKRNFRRGADETLR